MVLDGNQLCLRSSISSKCVPPDGRSSTRRYSPSATSNNLLACSATPDPNGSALNGVLSILQSVSLFFLIGPIFTLPQNVQVYRACCVTSIFLTCLRREAP